jgi:hypothetical protein
MGTALGLGRRLPQQVLAARKRAEELVIEVVPVGQHDDRRVLHRRFAHDPASVERHGQALARPLRVPDDADAAIAGLAAALTAMPLTLSAVSATAPFASLGVRRCA